MKMKNIKYQASPKITPMRDRRRCPRRKQSTDCVKMGRGDGQTGVSNLKDETVAKKDLKCKLTTISTEDKTSMCKKLHSCCDDDVKCRKLVAPEQVDRDRISWTKTLLPQTTLSMCPVSNIHQPVAPVAETLKKLLYAVKNLFSQHCLLEMLKVDIQVSSETDIPFQPKQQDWPLLLNHLQMIQIYLQDLLSLIDSQLPAAVPEDSGPADGAGKTLKEQSPAAAASVSAGAAAAVSEQSGSGGPSADLPSRSPSPSPEPEPSSDPDWPPEDEAAVDSPEEQPAAGDRRPPRQRRPSRQFACAAADCQLRPGVPRTFHSEKSLRMHQVACHGVKAASRRYREYTCPLCRSVQKRPRDLAAHIVTCQGKGEALARPAPQDGTDDPGSFIMCRLCHLCFPSGDLLRAHVCQYADTGGVIQELLGTGALSVSGAELSALRRFICHQCREEFRNPTIYRVHLQFCLPPPYSCELCGAELPCRRRLALHKMSEHRGVKGPLFFCRAAGCGLAFRLNAALHKHLVQRHSGQPSAGQPHACDVCDKKFIRKIYLTHHKLRHHHDSLRRDFVCEVCGARLGSSSALTVHVRSVHTRPQHPCEVCGKVFSRPDRLAVHAKIHTGVKPYKCSLCPRAFIQQCKLNDHLRRHRGERRFRCVMCDKMYAASQDLRAHLRRIHNVDMVNKTHTIQPTASMLRPLPPPEPEPEPEPEPVVQEPAVPEPDRTQQLSAVVPQALQGVQLHSVQVAAQAPTLHVQDISQLGGGLILIPALDTSGGTFYPVINQ